MEIGNIKGMKKFKSLIKIFFSFSRKTDNHIHTDTAVRHKSFDKCYFFSVQFAPVSAPHQPQYFIAAALQGNMKMRHELSAVAYKFDYLIRDWKSTRLNSSHLVFSYSVFFLF